LKIEPEINCLGDVYFTAQIFQTFINLLKYLILMATKPIEVRALKEGNYVMAEGEPAVVVGIQKSKTGKHGATKARIETMGLFDNRRRYILKPTSDNVEVPIIEKKKGQVLSVSGDIVQIMDLEDYSTFEATVPEELKARIAPEKEVSYWKIENRVLLKEVHG